MKQDIMINPDSGNILFKRIVPTNLVYYEVVWGNLFDTDMDDVLYANIIVPSKYAYSVKLINSQYICYVHASYQPSAENFMARMVVDIAGEYSVIDDQLFVSSVYTNMDDASSFSLINACQLPLIDIDGYFMIRFIRTDSSLYRTNAYLYSLGVSDMNIDVALPQESHLLSITEPGKIYRYPSTGVGLTSYINSIISHTDLADILQTQFERDNLSITDASFDALTGILDISADEGNGYESVAELDDKSTLDLTVFDQMTDDMAIYYNNSLPLGAYNWENFTSILSGSLLYNIYYCPDSSVTPSTNVETKFVGGDFDDYGNITGTNDYQGGIIMASISSDTFVVLETTSEFAVYDDDDNLLYFSGTNNGNYNINQGYYCVYANQDCKIAIYYTNAKRVGNRVVAAKGFINVPETDEEFFKDVVIVAQGSTSGRLTAYLTKNTNIKNVTVNAYNNQLTITRKDE